MIKNPIVTLALLTISTFALATSAFGADHKAKKGNPPPTTPESTESSYVSEPYSSSSEPSLAVGFTTGDLGSVLGSQAITAIMGLRNGDMIDARFAIPSTSPFNFGVGGIYKHTISQHGTAGFHVGGGLALGDINAGGAGGGHFAMTFAAVGGFHFSVPSVSAIKIHLDGGPAFTLVTSSPSFTNFQISALSPILGLSILYAF